MIIKPSDNPGSHERHLLRREQNPLFEQAQTDVNQDTLMESQQQDHDILLQFHRQFQGLLKECVALDENEETDKIMNLKGRLERLYVVACAIADDQSSNLAAIKKLVDTITGTIRSNVGNDTVALDELAQEEQAREMHYTLLKSKLVADLLQEQPVVPIEQLVPTLLSTDNDQLSLVLQIFDPAQLASIIQEGNRLLGKLDSDGVDVSTYAERLVFIEGYAEYVNNTDAIEPL